MGSQRTHQKINKFSLVSNVSDWPFLKSNKQFDKDKIQNPAHTVDSFCRPGEILRDN